MDTLDNMRIIDLVRRCKNGDEWAWNMIVDRYSKIIFNLALNFFGNREDAEDVSQDIFLKVYDKVAKFREEKNFGSWLLTLSKNHCIDHWRRHRKGVKRVELNESLIKNEMTPEDSAIRNYDLVSLRKKIAVLDPDLRLLLIMRDVQEFSYQEIADSLKLPLGTVKSRINRARIKLARTFLPEGGSNGL